MNYLDSFIIAVQSVIAFGWVFFGAAVYLRSRMPPRQTGILSGQFDRSSSEVIGHYARMSKKIDAEFS